MTFVTRSGKPLMLAASRNNMFDDSSDKIVDDSTLQSKYKQINKNLQGIISFCANKLGTTYARDEVTTEVNSFADDRDRDRPETSFSQATFNVDGETGLWRYKIPCEQATYYNSEQRGQGSHEGSPFETPNGNPQYRGEQGAVSYNPEPRGKGAHDGRPFEIPISNPLYRGEKGAVEMLDNTTIPADPNLKDFSNLIQNFILANTDGGKFEATGGSGRGPTPSGTRRLQIRRVNEVEVRSTPGEDGGTSIGSDGNKLVPRQFTFRTPESLSDQGPGFNPLGKQTLLSKYRNLVAGNTGSPFTPLKCAKCQLEMSKRELETLGMELNHMQGYHGCGHSGSYCCAGDEFSSIGQWECTCGQTPKSRTRELHRQEKQQESNRALVRSNHSNNTGTNCTQVQIYNPSHDFINFGCCCRPEMLRHGSCGVNPTPVNFLRHEDTHGKCKDCYRRENLSEAFKLKHVLDKQYERQTLSRWKERRDKELGHLLGRYPRDRSENRNRGSVGTGGINTRELPLPGLLPRYGNSDPALIVELDRSTETIEANEAASETIDVDGDGGQRKQPRNSKFEDLTFSDASGE